MDFFLSHAATAVGLLLWVSYATAYLVSTGVEQAFWVVISNGTEYMLYLL